MNWNAQLPVPFDHFVSQPMAISPEYTNYLVPQQPISNVQNIQNHVTLIISTLINDIASKSGQSPLRVFGFNLFSRNNYNNPDFLELLFFAAGVVDVEGNKLFQSGTNAPITSVISSACPIAVTLMLSVLVERFPMLMSILPPQITNVAKNNIGLYQTYKVEISNLNTKFNNHNTGFGMSGYMQQQQHINQHPPITNTTGGYGNIRSNRSVGFNTVSHSNTNNSQQDVSSSGNRFSKRLNNNNFNQPEVQAPENNTWTNGVNLRQPTQPEVVVEEEKVYTESDWKQSNLQKYKNLIDTTIYNCYYIKEFQSVIEKVKEKTDMDRSQHTVHAFGMSLKIDTHKRLLMTLNDVENLGRIEKPKETEVMSEIVEDENIKKLENTKECVYTNIEDAIIDNKLLAVKHERSVYLTNVLIAKPIIVIEDFKDTINNITSVEDLPSLAAKMSSSLNIVKTATSDASITSDKYLTSFICLLGEIDKQITYVINNWLTGNLGTNVTISSFMEDYPKLDLVLRSKKGPEIANGLLSLAEKHIEDILITLSDEVIESLLENVCGDIYDTNVNFVTQSYTIVSTIQLASELNLNASSEWKSVSYGLTPFVYELASTALELSKNSVRTIIVTADDVRYEITKSNMSVIDPVILLKKISN